MSWETVFQIIVLTIVITLAAVFLLFAWGENNGKNKNK
ncbi:hypothetical protein SEA_AMORE2_47 [Gordonia phage Amore2]|uniref:Uncharacterized protein n=2 Tax=Getseptimavirus TaxID=2560139 RepID=A0A0K0N6C2_9CAUD|nr:hypothetical protein GTE7_gp035 [Gordonia phage GTE7]YP_009189174.1 hypothetical protein AU104_gp081 [Gordonia phage GMA7]QSL99688.1 hypothetical protein SEA_AUSTIN_47 [Gordonia phage Austin]USH44862.1 hypothetical protein SEA_AMORE2_47 [Gordonia phage Amore2]AER26578.1 putative membrane protein [Gordonia phage GTE7]AKJ72474.1 hypothetical protein GMA7_37 [Gordonia phage GMA7]